MKTFILLFAMTLLASCGNDKSGSKKSGWDTYNLDSRGIEFYRLDNGMYQIACKNVGNVTNQTRINALNGMLSQIHYNMGNVQVEMGQGQYIDPQRMSYLLQTAIQTLQMGSSGMGGQWGNYNNQCPSQILAQG